MGMLVDRSSMGMALRSWRYSMPIDNGKIIKVFAEPGVRDNPQGVGAFVSAAETFLGYLKGEQATKSEKPQDWH